jgi:DNA-binding transcriptional regulator YdaS (Cro superfamily)
VAALFVFLILLAVGPTAGNRQLLGVVLLAATTAIAIEALRRQTLREFPENQPPALGKTPGPT